MTTDMQRKDEMASILWAKLEAKLIAGAERAQSSINAFRAKLAEDPVYALACGDRLFQETAELKVYSGAIDHIATLRKKGPLGRWAMDTLVDMLTRDLMRAACGAVGRSSQCSDILALHALSQLALLLEWVKHDVDTADEFCR